MPKEKKLTKAEMTAKIAELEIQLAQQAEKFVSDFDDLIRDHDSELSEIRNQRNLACKQADTDKRIDAGSQARIKDACTIIQTELDIEHRYVSRIDGDGNESGCYEGNTRTRRFLEALLNRLA